MAGRVREGEPENRRTTLAARAYAAATAVEARAYGLRERRVDVGDCSLAVLEGGPVDAPAVVLLHGVATLDDRLGEVTVPTLVMWGEEDRLVHPSTARAWADGIAGARTVRYPGIGHMPMLEAPRRSAADYRAFLARVGAGVRRRDEVP